MTGWQTFVWHLMNDPIRDNPWAFTLTVALSLGSLAGMVAGVGGIYEMWPGEWPAWARRRETGMTDTTRRRAQHAIANARRLAVAEPTMEIGEVEAPDRGPAFPLPATDYNLTLPARRTMPERIGRELATVPAHPGIHSTCPHCGGAGSLMRPVVDLLGESLTLVPDVAVLAAAEPDHLPEVPPADRPEPLFPADALVTVAHLYDPGDRESLARLSDALRLIAARGEGASLGDYAQAKTRLYNAFRDTLAERWRVEYGVAWSQAYDYAAIRLMLAQQEAALDGARYPSADA